MADALLDRIDRTHHPLFEPAGDYVFVLETDASGNLIIVDCSDAALKAHGYERAELVGQPINIIDPDARPEIVAEGLRSQQAGMPVVFTVKHRRKDGSIFDVEVRSTIVIIDGRRLIVTIERDIEKIRSSEERLRQMHDLMSYVIGHARSAIAVHDRDLNYIYVSERYLREYHVSEKDVIGRHHYDVFPDLPQKWRDVHQRALKGEVLSADEDPYERADGTVEWTRWECRPWYEQDGSIGGIIVYTEVITDRKHAEDEKKALEAQLQQAMKMEAVGRLAGGIAHDFNNLLTGIIGNVNVMMMDVSPDDPLAELLRETASAAESAASLTRQLLAFSRKQVIAPRELDVNELIRDLQRMLVRLIGEDITLETRLTERVAAVKVDPGQFEQVLTNLVVNARDAMPDGGHIIIETKNVELSGEYRAAHSEAREGAHVMLAVSDTGHGMSDEVKAHLFEPFFTTKGLGRGTGLGLASTFGAVKQAGGSIEVYSEVGLGTTVKIYLPAVGASASRLERMKVETQPLKGHETVLLVEDDDRVRRLAERVLARLGYRVMSAHNAAEALGQIHLTRDPIQLLITDVVMPSMNGRELAAQATALRPDMKVLFTSGYTENVIVHHGVLEDHLNFIAKPYTPHSLGQKVREVLEGKSTESR